VASRKTQEHQATLVSVLHEAIAGFRVVKAFGMEGRESQDFRELTRRVFRERMKVIRSRSISGPIIEMVSGIAAALVFIYAYVSQMQASELISFALGLFLLYDPVKKISRVNLQIQESMSAAERVFQILDTKLPRRLPCRACAKPSATKTSVSATVPTEQYSMKSALKSPPVQSWPSSAPVGRVRPHFSISSRVFTIRREAW
jgi:ABC-type multidrug transport system fused ATPase/permease subunit